MKDMLIATFIGKIVWSTLLIAVSAIVLGVSGLAGMILKANGFKEKLIN